MKALNTPQELVVPNAWGRDVVVYRQTFEVEQSDVGRVREHYLGYNRPSYTFKASDVGRLIVADTNTHCPSWNFKP